ncbi:MAG TPA: hypothetical protein VMX17_09590 [Candidatus Glassbacteria bacterium]|nr:hypothetical protein [Candidatus Glassbacteria bacterium]
MTSPTLYKEKEGVITEVRITYKELDKYSLRQGIEEFNEDGLAWFLFEEDLKKPNYEVNGEYFTIYTDATKTEIDIRFKAHHYSYSIKSEKMNSIYPERAIKKY